MMAKKSQLTLFIIIVVIMLILVGFFLYSMRNVSRSEKESLPSDIVPVYIYIEQCLKYKAEDSVMLVALQGGYYSTPEPSLRFMNIDLPYYLYDGNITMPSRERIEEELAKYLELNAPSCDDFSTFESKGYRITQEKPSVKATLAAKKVVFNVLFPAMIDVGEEQQRISEFNIEVDAMLSDMVNASYSYMEYQEKDKSALYISRLMEISNEKNLNFEVFSFGNARVISFIENRTGVEGKPLVYAFALDNHAEPAAEEACEGASCEVTG